MAIYQQGSLAICPCFVLNLSMQQLIDAQLQPVAYVTSGASCRDATIAALQREVHAATAEAADGRKLRAQLAAETSRRERLTIQVSSPPGPLLPFDCHPLSCLSGLAWESKVVVWPSLGPTLVVAMRPAHVSPDKHSKADRLEEV